MQVLTGRSVD